MCSQKLQDFPYSSHGSCASLIFPFLTLLRLGCRIASNYKRSSHTLGNLGASCRFLKRCRLAETDRNRPSPKVVEGSARECPHRFGGRNFFWASDRLKQKPRISRQRTSGLCGANWGGLTGPALGSLHPNLAFWNRARFCKVYETN